MGFYITLPDLNVNDAVKKKKKEPLWNVSGGGFWVGPKKKKKNLQRLNFSWDFLGQ